MSKIVINSCYGGFGLSHEAIVRYCELKNIPLFWNEEKVSSLFRHYYTNAYLNDENYFSPYDIYQDRDDPFLIRVIEEMGEKSWGACAELEIIELPIGTLYVIDEYDGYESITTSRDEIPWKVAK